ncbi:retropepsin-like aspartic protease [Desulfoluna spongiiphila]|uniref:Aspartyl protease n=1 Tax=Desulfoluna spongiiphila TaxID=419481 RepID=A0A1G5BRU5_9BACT|nr:retropepsin-like aspartic protease [Desulfoluna spongiiphila]SCX92945.1 Aspartyl protease [Desulfoluna spongiiphila]
MQLRNHIFGILAMAWLLSCQTGYAEFYQYRNEDGVICFTDDLSEVPQEEADKSKVFYDQFDERPEESRVELKEEEMTKEELERKANPLPEAASRVASTRFTFADNKILVRVTIGNNSRSVSAILLLDTGASTTVIHEALARRVGLRNMATGQASVAGGHTIQTGITTADFISLGPKRLDNPTITVIPYYGGHTQHEGLLGMDFLKNFPHTIDTANHRILWAK